MQRHAPATLRNRDAILAVLAEHLPPEGTVLELASGSGEHAIFFAPALAPRQWQPSDVDEDSLKSINAWRDAENSPCLVPMALDVQAPVWPPEIDPPAQRISCMVCINMLHISPWKGCEGLMVGAERILRSGDMLFVYGPFKRGGEHTAPSNEAFDISLQRRNPQWGVRNLESVLALADGHHLSCAHIIEMPANNLSLVLTRR